MNYIYPTPIESIEKDEEVALVNLICVNLDKYARMMIS